MPRIACLHIPQFPIAVQQNHEKELTKDAQKSLLRALVSYSPKVSARQGGFFFLDASGLNHMGGEHTFCRRLLHCAQQLGYKDIHVGIADSAFTAQVASSTRKPWHAVAAGGNAEFLAPLSIKYLPLESDLLDTLSMLGITTMGQLAQLPPDAVAERLGHKGLQALELAQGKDQFQPTIPALQRVFQCSAEAGVPINSLTDILFVLKSMLDRLTRELKQSGFQAEELLLSCTNNEQTVAEYPLKLLRPSNQPKFLLDMLKLAVEAQIANREFTGLTLAITKFTKESWQQTEISSTHSSISKQAVNTPELSNSLLLLLQRFSTRLGTTSIVKAIQNDQHFPEQSGRWISILEKPEAGNILPVNSSLHPQSQPQPNGLVLRTQEKIPVLVEFDQGNTQVAAVAYKGRWHQVKAITIAECLSGMWWNSPIAKSYYVAAIADRQDFSLILLVHDASPSVNDLERAGKMPALRPFSAGGTPALPVSSSPAGRRRSNFDRMPALRGQWFIEGFFD